MHKIFTNTNIDNSLYKIKEYKKGDIIFSDGDICNSVGFIEKGEISIITNTYNENEYEINHLTDDGFFGTYLLFSSNPYYLGTAIAKRNSKIIIFTKSNLLKAFEDKTFLQNYLSLTSDSSIHMQQKIKVLSQGSIKEKIMFLIYQNKEHIFTFKTKEQLALFLNVPRPSLSRVLIELQNDGLITYDRHTIKAK